MYSPRLHIAIMEPSRIIFEGLQTIICHSSLDCRVSRVERLEELTEMMEHTPVEILIANPMQFVNLEKEVKKLRKSYPTLAIAGIDFGIIHRQSILTDISFTLYDTPEHIIHSLTRLQEKSQHPEEEKEENNHLSPREIEVLTCLVNGMLNKEIADHLHISVHTVVRHRKNITQKTGIRSQSGLTIYAISKKIIHLEDMEI
ncbi:MAG: LuxR C-terminal-related transcriptional regulator [Proteiniphilum sp.]|jgi:DNA-binding CsgD family transcriptional regulator|nr:LuxR C-terminal-related transcriptional regulator [Proteiniphilum sp.]HHT34424.1 response regulator transcription factor [Bacteroidales bacterium]MDD3979722.1 LuxR C-terminal-related transcriptional regulator [Proteiniphilum sp.]MDD5346617.1 LuxR C-terminal-related transcriptional regulator [Proteiniphilum sp.]MDD5619467.1 LuxR C-terminal-related transcriptional regulator [Proteiniphilum sp.]